MSETLKQKMKRWQRDRDEWLHLRQIAQEYRDRGAYTLADMWEKLATDAFWKWSDRSR